MFQSKSCRQWLNWGDAKADHVKPDSPQYVFLTKILRDNWAAGSPPMYATLHWAVSCNICSCFTDDTCRTDINECDSSPCENNGTCEDRVNGFTCHCPPGWTGNYDYCRHLQFIIIVSSFQLVWAVYVAQKDSGHNVRTSAIPRKFPTTRYWTVTAGIAKSTTTPTHMTTSPVWSHRPDETITHP